MSAEIINLRAVRKARQRQRDAVKAEENRRRYSLTAEEKQRIAKERELADRKLDALERGHSIDDGDDLDPGNVS